nr:MAG TPA: hypothetical protein [Caudoviricetes sp.]
MEESMLKTAQEEQEAAQKAFERRRAIIRYTLSLSSLSVSVTALIIALRLQ